MNYAWIEQRLEAIVKMIGGEIGLLRRADREAMLEKMKEMRDETLAQCKREIDRMAMRLRSEMLQDKLDQERRAHSPPDTIELNTHDVN